MWRGVPFSIVLLSLIYTEFCCNAQPSASQATNTVQTIIIGNFGSVTGGIDTFPSPSLPSGSFLPYKASWSSVANQVITSYLPIIAGMYPSVTVALPTVINTQGNIFSALSSLSVALNTSIPNAIIVMDSYDVARAIQMSVVQSYGASIVIIMALTSSQNVNFASPAVAPSSMRLAPSDTRTAAAIVATMQNISWQSFSMIQSSDDYGASFVSSITSIITTTPFAPKMVDLEALVGWAAPGRDASDQATITRLAAAGATGVVAAGGPGFAARVINAYLRVAAVNSAVATSGLFFLFTPPAMLDFPQYVPPDTTNALPFTSNAIMVPLYTNRASLPNFPIASTAGDGLAFAMSYVLDGLTVIAAAAQSTLLAGLPINSTTLLNAALSVNITTGTLTGPISFNSNRNRAQTSYLLVQLSSNPYTPSLSFASVSGTQVTLTGAAAALPQSLLNAVQVCLITSTLCSAYADANAAVMTLLDANSATPVDPTAPRLPSGISYKISTIAAGNDGVNAISQLSAYNLACNVIVGPSSTALAVAINPLTSYYAIPTVDFSSTSPLLSNKYVYPSYMRVVQSEIVIIQAFTALFTTYQWLSVAVITTRDAYGNAFLTAMQASPTIALEATYSIDTSNNNALSGQFSAAFNDILNNLITRIVIVAFPPGNTSMITLFNVVLALQPPALSTIVFYFTDSVCQYLALNPTIRGQLLGSICAVPAYNTTAFAAKFASLSAAYNTTALTYLAAGGFPTSTCSQNYIDVYSPMAHDAVWAVTLAMSQMITSNGGSLKSSTNPGTTITSNGSAVYASILNVSFVGSSGPIAFTANGDRVQENYNFTIQQNGFIAVLGTWSAAAGYQNVPQPTPLLWQGNTTTVPSYSIRSVVFIASKTAATNPAAIVISVFGFVLTIAAFVFAYKYHTMSKKMAGIELRDGAPATTTAVEMTPAAK